MPSGPLVMPDGFRKHRSLISVAVTDGNGQPISGISVNLTGKTDDGDYGIEVLDGTGIITTSDGVFTFSVPPGKYTISPQVPQSNAIVGSGSHVVTVSGGHPATVSFAVRPATPPR
jgi:protocatechuate 3,4-dioxygenase beta subunit